MKLGFWHRIYSFLFIFLGRFYIESGYLQCMVEYNVVKFCRFCKNRFVVGKREARRMYCDACEKKVAKMPDN
jgi:hypothetical protein